MVRRRQGRRSAGLRGVLSVLFFQAVYYVEKMTVCLDQDELILVGWQGWE